MVLKVPHIHDIVPPTMHNCTRQTILSSVAHIKGCCKAGPKRQMACLHRTPTITVVGSCHRALYRSYREPTKMQRFGSGRQWGGSKPRKKILKPQSPSSLEVSQGTPQALCAACNPPIPGTPVACNHGPLCLNYGLLCGIVASYFVDLAFQVPSSKSQSPSSKSHIERNPIQGREGFRFPNNFSDSPPKLGLYRGLNSYLCHPKAYFPEGPSTQYLRTLAPKAIKGMVFGTIVLKYWVLGPSGFAYLYDSCFWK